MTKKLIISSVILAVFIGALGLASMAKAVGEEVVFSADTTVGISDLVIQSGGQVTSIAVGASSVTLALGATSDITFESASGAIMSVDCGDGATFTAGFPSRMRVDYHASCASVVLTTGEGTLTEVNVKAVPLAVASSSSYTINFRTVNALTSGQKIKLVFGGGFTILSTTTASLVTTLEDDDTDISSSISLASVAGTKTITITLASNVAAKSIVDIVLSSTLVTNPPATTDATVSGIDIYTTTATDTTIDSKTDQTAYNRVIDLVPGWNIFAPSQALETATYATVLAPISGSYNAIYTLAWDTTVTPNTMTWQTPTNIEPLTGYAIYITGGSTVKLPLDFAKETVSNALFSRNLDHAGWYLVGYTGTATNPLESQDAFLDGLTVAGNREYSVVVDLTGTTVNSQPSDHDISGANTTETQATGDTAMDFYMDFGYAIFTTVDSLVLGGNREE